jgi:ubiquinone/menaquinone biosynthesis C-methylase UbiE
MGWFLSAVYDSFMRSAEQACLGQWRAELLADLKGDVLEIGAGTGASVQHYPPSVARLVLCEPDRHMRTKLHQNTGKKAEISDASVMALPFPDESFDAVVSLLVLCSVPTLPGALAEMRRVLVPGGKLVFVEHVAAWDRPDRLEWQRRFEPIWKRMAGNCHLTRETESAITEGGFEVQHIVRQSMRKAIAIARPCIRGVATKTLPATSL